MNEFNTERLTDKATIPDEDIIKDWIGAKNFKLWEKLRKYVNENYEGVFQQDDWIFGGKKHGWSLRYKKSKSFCSLIPEKGKFRLLVVFGADERERAEAILPLLNPAIKQAYDEATTYHDGKWALFTVNNSALLNDLQSLLSVKRKPVIKE